MSDFLWLLVVLGAVGVTMVLAIYRCELRTAAVRAHYEQQILNLLEGRRD